MNWKDYEVEIFDCFKNAYPNARISLNQKVIGRYSKTERQIDILIEDYVAGRLVRLVVDGKFFYENIDVKEVEAFISMVEDVEATEGILVTKKGYSKAAINRAYYGPTSVELDIMNFEDLQFLQGHGGIVYSGSHGAILPAPFGWIVDAKQREGHLCSMYQRGLSFEEAIANEEWMYVNILSRGDATLEDVLRYQEDVTKQRNPRVEFAYRDSIPRSDNACTKLRTIKYPDKGFLEFTGFIQFEEFVLFIVLFTPPELQRKNIRKLEYLVERVLPINVNEESILTANLTRLERLLGTARDEVETAGILSNQGDIYKRLGRYEIAEQKYNESLDKLASCYGAIKGRLDLYLLLSKEPSVIGKAVDQLFELGPENPTVCQDLMKLFEEHRSLVDVVPEFQRKLEDLKHNEEAVGNILYHLGLLYEATGNADFSRQCFMKAQRAFKKVLKEDHYVLQSIDKKLNVLR